MKATEIALGVVCIGLLALSFVLGSELNNTNKKLRDLANRPAQVVKEVEYVYTETVPELECPPCPGPQEILVDVTENYDFRVEGNYFWIYKRIDGEWIPIGFKRVGELANDG